MQNRFFVIKTRLVYKTRAKLIKTQKKAKERDATARLQRKIKIFARNAKERPRQRANEKARHCAEK
jgi:hypothetical protein